MAEYIEREALVEELINLKPSGYSQSVLGSITLRVIDNQPAADVQEARHGEWVTMDYRYGYGDEADKWVQRSAEYGDYAQCSLCGKDALLNGGEEYALSDYCPHCGAKMDGKGDA